MDRFIRTLTINSRKNLDHIQIFGQMYWLEGSLYLGLPLLLGSFGACPKRLTITIRHSDWWHWEMGLPLELKDAWIQKILNWQALPRLREICVEFETLESHMSELRPILDKLRGKFAKNERLDHFGDRVFVELAPSPPERTWSGSTELGRWKHALYADLEKLDYRIVTLVWTVRPAGSKDAEEHIEMDGDCASMTHISGPELPVLSIDRPSKEDVGSTLSQMDALATEQKIAEWREQGSLLKFASVVAQERPRNATREASSWREECNV